MPAPGTSGGRRTVGPGRMVEAAIAHPRDDDAPRCPLDPHRADQPPARSQPCQQHFGDDRRDAVDEDAVEAPQRPVGLEPIGMAQLDRADEAAAGDALLCRQSQRAVTLKRDHRPAHRRQQRRDIARAGADLEHPRAGLEVERGQQRRDRVRRGHRLTAGQRTETSLPSEIGKARRGEAFARDLLHGAQHGEVAHALCAQRQQGRRRCARPRSPAAPRSWARLPSLRGAQRRSNPGAASEPL